MSDPIDQFRALHESGIFVMPNAWDIGSARCLAGIGFPAIATTSSGHAASLGRPDQSVTRDELLAHAEALASAVEVPISVDAEYCFASDLTGVAETVRLIAATGAAGCSIEDWNPFTGQIDPLGPAADRVAAAVEAAGRSGMVLTARAENHLYGIEDLKDTIRRLTAYRDAGADVLYAPGLTSLDDIGRVVENTGWAVNVLATAEVPSVSELESVGVRRVSTGGALSRAAFGTLHRAARELLDLGTSTYLAEAITSPDLNEIFAQGSPAPGR